MPKSRFNAVREKARASRHNPIHRNDNKNDKDEKSNLLDTPLTLQPIEGEKGAADVLPLLKSLPLPNSTSNSSHEDALWALTSLNGFWSTKSLRNELLAPKYDIISRILVQLQKGDDRPIEVRDAASGCLRNLCIEAGGKVRKALESKGSISVCIQEVNYVASDLGLKEGDLNEIKMEKRLQNNDLSKSKTEMNRKERRHAAKAEAALSKQQSKGQEKERPTNDEVMDQDKSVANEFDDDRTAIRCSHLNNLAAVIWCLAEMSPHAADECERAASLLGKVISQTVARGTKALQNQQNNENGHSKTDGKINVGKKDQKLIDDGWIEASSTCLNALVTLSDSNANICAALVGIDRPELMAALKKKKSKGALVLDEGLQEEATRIEGRENVQSLCSAIQLLQQSQNGKNGDKRITSLGLLALAAMRNVQSSLPLSLTRVLKVENDVGGTITLSDYESTVGLQVLQNVINKGFSTQTTQDEISNLNLALEVLAELVGDRESWNVGSSSNTVEQVTVEDDEVDEEMEMEDLASDGSDKESLDGEDDETMSLGDEGDVSSASNGLIDFQQTRTAKTFSAPLMNPLCKLAFDLDPNSPALTISTANKEASTQRGTAIRALSVLNNDLLVLASFAQPPPSQPVQDATHKQKIKSFHSWLSQQRELMGQIWRFAFETASRCAASPIISIDESNQKADEEVRTSYVEVKRILESSLGIMWSMARCYEGVKESFQILFIESDKFAKDSHCILAGNGGGLIESVIAAYRGSSQDTKANNSTIQERESTLSVNDPTTWASADGIRVNCLGLLSTLCRQDFIWQNYLELIVNFLIQTLEGLPAQKGSQKSQSVLTSLGLTDWTSCDGMVVAINGLIDTFADEKSVWDSLYKSLKIHTKLKRASLEIRLVVRTIDKRTQSSLRIAADEALENLMGFISYRESIKAV